MVEGLVFVQTEEEERSYTGAADMSANRRGTTGSIAQWMQAEEHKETQ